MTLSACGSSGTNSAKTAPSLSDPSATASSLVTRFTTLLHNHDVTGLKSFLAPAFQLQRADGSGLTKEAYLNQLPTVNTFQITGMTAAQDGPVLVGRFLGTATGLVDGKPYTPGPAPRLAVFVWNGTQWQLVAYANFNPLSG